MPQNLSPVILGLWPIAGVTTLGVTQADAIATIETAIAHGVRTFDSAFSYGYDGESDRYIGPFLRQSSPADPLKIIGKVGQRWSEDRQRVIDGRPETLIADAETSLERMGISCFDLLMLHSPDPKVPVAESAGAVADLLTAGAAKRVGICNATPAQRAEFAQVIDCSAIQTPLNLLQREALIKEIPEAAAAGTDVHVYWTLMKGLLAGKISRDHVFSAGDSRPNYPIFQGEARRKAHDAIDALQVLAAESGLTIAQLAIGWAASQPGVSGALVGARRPEQAAEIAATRLLGNDLLEAIQRVVRSTY